MKDDTIGIGAVHPSLGNVNLPASAVDSPAFHEAFIDNLPEKAKEKFSAMFTWKLLEKSVDMLDAERAKVKELQARLDELQGNEPVAKQPAAGKKPPTEQIALRVPTDVLERWRATGQGWQTRMVQRLSAP